MAAAAALAGERDEAAFLASVAGDPDEPMSQNRALEEGLDLVNPVDCFLLPGQGARTLGGPNALNSQMPCRMV